MDLEEGELSGSDEQELELTIENRDYNELPRPSLPTRIRNDELSYAGSSNSGDSDSGETSDSDNDFQPPSSKLHMKQKLKSGSGIPSKFRNPNFKGILDTTVIEDSKQASASSYEGMANKFQARRKNNIWCDVLEEQGIGSTADELGMVVFGEDVQTIKRGPESFTIERILKRKYIEHGNDLESTEDSIGEEDSNESFSSSGLSDDSKEFLRFGKLSTSGTSSKTDKALKTKNHRGRLKQNMVEYTSGMSDEKLCLYVAGQLLERKTYLILNVLKHLGREVVLHLFVKTLLIERNGGILVKNGVRRRTAGGVFLYLLRGNKKLDRSIIQKIFDDDRAEANMEPFQDLGSVDPSRM